MKKYESIIFRLKFRLVKINILFIFYLFIYLYLRETTHLKKVI